VFVAGSLASRPTAPEVLVEWDRRSAGERPAGAQAPTA
jgi:solute:Na+ symporter, SSS family